MKSDFRIMISEVGGKTAPEGQHVGSSDLQVGV